MSPPQPNLNGPSSGRMWENWSPRVPANLVVLSTKSPRRLWSLSEWKSEGNGHASGVASVGELPPADVCWERVSFDEMYGCVPTASQNMAELRARESKGAEAIV